jgi:hypothetical protein
VLKNGGASTLDIVANLRALLPRAQALLPADVKVTPLFDQSVFVKAAIKGVIAEGAIAAVLTAAMVLLFLGSWRSTLIIALTIPLSVLSSILMLRALGETLNLMTLGGLALSVGILVDQAIVTIENIERHIHLGRPLHDAITIGAGEIGVPAFVSTLCICIVFVPMFFLPGVARFLFVPMAEAVVFAMAASYLLSRTLVPTLVMLLMKNAGSTTGTAPGLLQRLYLAFDRRFERVRRAYTLALSALLARRRSFAMGFTLFCVLSCGLFPLLGRDFFPSVDAGQIRLHMRAPTGMRIEETARLADAVEAAIRQLIPPEELHTMLDNIGVPNSGINLSYSNAGTIGTLDGEVLMSLKRGPPAHRDWVTLLAQRTAAALCRVWSSSSSPPTSSRRSSTSGCRRPLTCSSPAPIRRAMPRWRRSWPRKSVQDPRRRGRARAPADGRPAPALADGPHAAAADGLVGGQRGPERADVRCRAVRRRAGVLAQPAERRGLQHRDPVAAVPGGLARRAAEHSGGPPGPGGGPTAVAGQPGGSAAARQLPIVSRYNI